MRLDLKLGHIFTDVRTRKTDIREAEENEIFLKVVKERIVNICMK